MTDSVSPPPVALITGAARRIGAATARHFHARGWNLLVHYSHSEADAAALVQQLNDARPNSAHAIQADLNQMDAIQHLASSASQHWGYLNALINNASTFYPTPLGQVSPQQWDDLINVNLKAPLFLSQALADSLRAQQGVIINLIDIHADRPLRDHPVYCAAKAGLAMLTKSMAKDLAPAIRVNGVAPGAILWPEQAAALAPEAQSGILSKVPLGRTGGPDAIATSIYHLAAEADYVTGQILAVDGGRSLSH